jgi:hypothetical protein
MAVSDDIRIYVDAAVPATLNDGAAALHRRDVNEDVLATALRLDEAVTLGGVEPFHGTCRHLNCSDRVLPPRT